MVRKIIASKKTERTYITPFLKAVAFSRRGWSLEAVNLYFEKWKTHYNLEATEEEKGLFLDHLWLLVRAILIGNELVAPAEIVRTMTNICDEVRTNSDVLDWIVIEPESPEAEYDKQKRQIRRINPIVQFQSKLNLFYSSFANLSRDVEYQKIYLRAQLMSLLCDACDLFSTRTISQSRLLLLIRNLARMEISIIIEHVL
jgi:hypothetical protein